MVLNVGMSPPQRAVTMGFALFQIDLTRSEKKCASRGHFHNAIRRNAGERNEIINGNNRTNKAPIGESPLERNKFVM